MGGSADAVIVILITVCGIFMQSNVDRLSRQDKIIISTLHVHTYMYSLNYIKK